MKTITVQPAPHTDHVTEDGTELTQLPYPFHVAEDGSIGRQDFWNGRVARVVGFTARPEAGPIVLTWREVWADPEKAVGRYLITSDSAGRWSTHLSAIMRVKVNEEAPAT